MDTKIEPPPIQFNLAVYSKAFLKEQKRFPLYLFISLYISASETDTDLKNTRNNCFSDTVLCSPGWPQTLLDSQG